MSDNKIHPLLMPKWGLSMAEGKIVGWLVEQGATIQVGAEILEVETDKIAGAVEAVDAGVLRRALAQPEQILPVGALLGVLTEGEVSEAEVDAFVERFMAEFVPETTDEQEAESAYQWIQAGAQRLRYAKQGDGDETVILVHGFGGDLDNWLFNLVELAAKRTVYALDLPGHGQSDKIVGDGSLRMLTQALQGFMDALAIDRAHLVGHSMGGAVIQQFACEHPRRICSLALIGSAGLGEDINSGYIDGFIDSRGRRDTKAVLQQLFSDSSLVSRQMVDDILKYKRLDGVGDALRRIAAALFTDGRQQTLFRDRLAGLGMPVQVIWGSEDNIIPAVHAQGLPESVAVTVLDGYGHMVQMEAAGEVNRLLQAHFAAC